MENHAKSNIRLKVSSVGELTISIGSLFNEMGSLTLKAAFSGVSENCGGAT